MKEKAKPPLSIGADLSGFRFRCNTTLDWLQIDSRGTLKNSAYFETKDTQKTTSVFNKLYEIWKDKNYIASIVSEPIEDFLPKNMNLIKLLNRELYYPQPIERIIAISLDHQLVPYSASRIDFTIDFNTFLNNYKPTTFIKNFANDKILKKGTKRGTLSFDNKKLFQTHSIKFFKPDSNISVNLYNKSKEMREVKNKPWIVESWKKAGLDLTQDVWRLEFAIHSPKFQFTNRNTGETEKFNYQKLDDKNYLNLIINVLISKYFDFRRNTGIKDISDMPKLKLFPNIECYDVVFERNNGIEGTKSDYLLIKKLKELNNEVRRVNPYITQCNDSIIKYIKKTRELD